MCHWQRSASAAPYGSTSQRISNGLPNRFISFSTSEGEHAKYSSSRRRHRSSVSRLKLRSTALADAAIA
jgi:hypothetical protein